MSSMNPLGRTHNAAVSVTTAAKRVNLKDCSGVLFYLTNSSGATAATFSESNAASGGTTQALAAITEYWTQATGTGVWTRSTQAAASTITSINAVGALHAVYIPQGALSDGFGYLSASHATGTFLMVLSDLDVKRVPQNLADVTV